MRIGYVQKDDTTYNVGKTYTGKITNVESVTDASGSKTVIRCTVPAFSSDDSVSSVDGSVILSLRNPFSDIAPIVDCELVLMDDNNQEQGTFTVRTHYANNHLSMTNEDFEQPVLVFSLINSSQAYLLNQYSLAEMPDLSYNSSEKNIYLGEQSASLSSLQDLLVSGQNIKTINNQSLLGSGNINIDQSGSPIVNVTWTNGASAGPTLIINNEDGSSVTSSPVPTASTTTSGVVTTGSQTFSGDKAFNNSVTTLSNIILTEGVNYTTTLPSSGVEGQLVFVLQ